MYPGIYDPREWACLRKFEYAVQPSSWKAPEEDHTPPDWVLHIEPYFNQVKGRVDLRMSYRCETLTASLLGQRPHGVFCVLWPETMAEFLERIEVSSTDLYQPVDFSRTDLCIYCVERALEFLCCP